MKDFCEFAIQKNIAKDNETIFGKNESLILFLFFQ
jgi:hypothetical protein